MRAQVEEDNLSIDMAPLIDCVFLLLIFFLVATTLKKIDKELPLELPDSEASMDVQQPDQYSIVSIDREGMFYVDGNPVTDGMLQDELRARARETDDYKVRLDVHKTVPFVKVMQVLDILRFEGIKNVGINSVRKYGEKKK